MVEVLLSLVITSLVVAGAVSATRALTTAEAQVRGRTARLGEARRGLDAIAAALRNVRRDGRRGESTVVGGPSEQGLGDWIDLLVIDERRVRAEGPESDQQELSFFLGKPRGWRYPVLMCRRDHDLDEKPREGGLVTVLAEGIADVRFEYFTGAEWETQWTELEPRPPKAVRVTLTAMRTDEETPRGADVVTLRTAVRIESSEERAEGGENSELRTQNPEGSR